MKQKINEDLERDRPKDERLSQKTETDLHASERQMSELLENLHLLAVINDLDGKIIYCNPYFLKYTGWQKEEVLGCDYLDRFIPPEHRDLVYSNFIPTIQEGNFPKRIENKIVIRSGERRYISWNNAVIKDRDGRIVAMASIGEDITHRKRAETAVRESERRYASLAAAAPVGIFRTDVDGNCIYVNHRWCQIAGLNFEKAQGTGWVWGLHPEDRDRVVQQWYDSVRDNVMFCSEYRFLRSDAVATWVFAQAVAERADNGKIIGYIGTIIDISDRKQAEQAIQHLNADLERRVQERTAQLTQEIEVRQQAETLLRRREREFKALVENAPDVIARLDRQLHYLYINPAIEKESGIPPQEVIDRTLSKLGLPEDTITAIEREAKAVLSTGQEGNLEFSVRTRQGTKFYHARIVPEFDLEGNIESVLAISRDITEQKQTEANLREANRRWHSLLEGIQLAVVGLDERGNVNYVNPFMLKITGYDRAEVLGKNWFTHFLPSTHADSVHVAFEELLEQNFHPYYENPILTKTGEERLIAWNNTILRDLQGKSIGSLSIGEDITEQHAIEQIKNEFVSIVSHELRTPLTSIRGSLGLLATGIYDNRPEKAKRMLEIAVTDCERLVRLVNDILDLERLESGKVTLSKEVCEVDFLMEQAVNSVRAIADRANITLEVASLSHQISAAPDAIVQTLTNLLSNAIKFSDPGSSVSLSANLDSDAIVFCVRDRGKGIPSDKLETIFGRFQQVDASDSRQKGGTGLGLAICKSLVEKHKGRIWAESTIGQGSTFCFTLPLNG
jgi:PAS domain S-box-containing protein